MKITRLLLDLRFLNSRRSILVALGLTSFCWVIMLAGGMPFCPWLVLLPLLLISVLTDTTGKFIPNWLTASAIALQLLIASTENSPEVLGTALRGLTITFCVSLLLYVTMGLGAGDVKLAAGIGACLGPEAAITMLFTTYMIAGLAAILTAFLKWVRPRDLICTALAGPGVLSARHDKHTDIDQLAQKFPMAPWFAIGTLLTTSGASIL